MDDTQFMNEAVHVRDICHPNIVRFEGYCYSRETKMTPQEDGRNILVDEHNRVLCFEYMPNGSLDKHLSDESSGLDWHARYNIIKGICAGLYFLHEGRKGAPILHLDLKPSNILLDKNMTPKIADFGLSRLVDGGKTHTIAENLVGTCGYMAPEYIDSKILSTKTDIFSLGVIIVQISGGARGGPAGALAPPMTCNSKIVIGERIYPEGTSNEGFTEVRDFIREGSL